MLDVEDSIFVLHSLLSGLRRDPRSFHLFDMPEEDLVAFKLGFSSSWMMGNYTITVKILSQQEFADSHIDSNQDPSEVAPLDVNLTVGGNTVELSEFESGLHYLLGIKQGGSCLLGWVFWDLARPPLFIFFRSGISSNLSLG